MRSFLLRLSIVLSLALIPCSAVMFAQEAATTEEAAATEPAATEPAATEEAASAETSSAESSPAKMAYDKAFAEWKTLLNDMRELQGQARDTDDAALPALVTKYDQMIQQGEAMIPKLRDAAIEVYKEAPNEDKQIFRWLSTIAQDYVSNDRFEDAKPALDALRAGKAPDPTIANNAGIVAFTMNDFEAADALFAEAAAAGVLTSTTQQMQSVVVKYAEYWKEEKKLRDRADSLTGDAMLPRVKMETNRGTMIIELFEDEAPETVGNFVNLVELGFYDGLTFHRVLAGFMAQGGDPEGSGSGGPGYTIYCECHEENHRKHFAGTLSMAHAGRDTGGSQFFLTFTPQPQLNGKHTVFGRVVEGMDVLAKLKRRDPSQSKDLTFPGDKIIKAEVLNKRDREYLPNKVR